LLVYKQRQALPPFYFVPALGGATRLQIEIVNIMPIAVTCPNCLTRFSVSEKYAGKSGPCPKCKGTIKIPDKTEEVVIHAPADKAPKDSKGRSIFKPIRREEVKLGWPIILSASMAAVITFGIAVAFRVSQTPPPSALLALAVILLAIPLVLAGYWFLRDDDLQGYTGRELWIRCAVCALAFAIGWALYRWVPAFISDYASLVEMTTLEMLVMILMMIALGTVAAVLSLELELGQAVALYMLYFILTFTLAWVSGTPMAAVLPGTAAPNSTPAARQPGDIASPSSQDARPETVPSAQPPREIPKLLQ
jgi:hypothetical protein